MPLTPRDYAIAAAIKEAGGWITAKRLAAVTGVPQRQLRECVHNLRVAGDPRCSCIVSSSQRGYFWCADESHIDNLARPLEKHSRKQLAAMSGLRKAARRANRAQGVLL